jgi:hypothetical protein
VPRNRGGRRHTGQTQLVAQRHQRLPATPVSASNQFKSQAIASAEQ